MTFRSRRHPLPKGWERPFSEQSLRGGRVRFNVAVTRLVGVYARVGILALLSAPRSEVFAAHAALAAWLDRIFVWAET
jgi:hypothetical protein